MSWHALGDWGTTRLRLFRIEAGQIVDRMEGPGALGENPATAIRDALAQWRSFGAPDFVHLCGMAGARTGLREAPYVDCPADARAWRKAALTFDLDGIPFKIAPGAACRHDGQADVMRGEETQIFGACALDASLQSGERLLILPGTHSKWVIVQDGAISEFRTFISGELFALLQNSSLLSPATVSNEQEAEGFSSGLERAQSNSALSSALFEARTAQLRDGRSPTWARAFISGLLIGAEIAEMSARRTLPSAVAIIGAPALAARYESALAGRAMVLTLDGEACAVRGLGLLHADD